MKLTLPSGISSYEFPGESIICERLQHVLSINSTKT